MFDLIFLGIGVFLALLFVGIGLLKGRKQVRTFAWIKLSATALSLILSVLFSVLLARAISNGSINLLTKNGILSEFGQMLNDAPIFGQMITALIAMILAPMFFFWLFLILKAILNFIARRIAKAILVKKAVSQDELESREENKPKKAKKFAILRSKKSEPIGMLCGAVCGLLIFFAFMVPLMGTFTLADSVVGTAATLSKSNSLDTVEEITDAAANNTAAKILRAAGGDLTFNLLTTQKVDGEFVCLSKEIKFLSTATETLSTAFAPETTPAQASAQLLEMEDAFDRTAMIPTLLPSLLTSANEKWDANESFLGIQKPLASSSTGSAILSPVLHGFADADADTVREDIKSVIEILAVLAENDALDQIKTQPMGLIENEELSAKLFCELFENEHLRLILGEVSEGGLSILGEKIGMDFGSIQLHMQEIENPEQEAVAFAHALHCSMDVFAALKNHPTFDAEMIRTAGPMLDAFAHTSIFGEETTTVFIQSLLSSEKVSNTLGFSEEETNNIVAAMTQNATDGYTTIMDTVGHSLEVVQIATQTTQTVGKLDEKVEELIETMTPASAEVLKAVTTPSLMVTKGVPAHSADATSDMLTNMFDNLSSAKQDGLEEEEYQKEAAATTNMLNMAMAAKQSGSKELFGEGSATGKSADEFVGEIFASDVISQTMIETVYAEEDSTEPTINPLGTKRNLKENEKAEILSALNNAWEQASDEQRSDETYQKQYLAMGAMMNLPVEITENGIVDASLLNVLPPVTPTEPAPQA